MDQRGLAVHPGSGGQALEIFRNHQQNFKDPLQGKLLTMEDIDKEN